MLPVELYSMGVPGLHEAILAEDYAAITGQSLDDVVDAISSQEVLGALHRGKWYVEAPPFCEDQLRAIHSRKRENNIATEDPLPQLQSLAIRSEEDLYAQAFSEMHSDRRRPGLWAKALSESLGDDKKTHALYLRYRKEQLQAEQEQQNQSDEEVRRSKVIVFKCPVCGMELSPVTQGIIDDCLSGKSADGVVQCSHCTHRFDLRDVLPKLRTDIPHSPMGLPSPICTGEQKTTRLATASLICGICGLAYPTSFLFLSSIAGIICGHMALNRIRTSPKRYDGTKRATAGLFISYIALALGIILGFAIGSMRADIRSAAQGL